MQGKGGKGARLLIAECTGLCLVVALFACALAGCAKNENSQAVLPHAASVGSMTISYPDGFPNVQETSIASTYLPEGMSCTDAILIANDDYSIVIEAAMVDDPRSFGIAVVQDYWGELAVRSKEENDEKFEQQFPELHVMVEEAVIEEPRFIDINGNRALVIAQTIKETVRQVFYYVESNDRIVGFVYAVFPSLKYRADPSYFEEIFESIEIS